MDTMSAAWLASDDTSTTMQLPPAGQPVTKGVYADDTVTYYWYAANGVVYDIETSDEAVATAVVAGIVEGAVPVRRRLPDPSTNPATRPVAAADKIGTSHFRAILDVLLRGSTDGRPAAIQVRRGVAPRDGRGRAWRRDRARCRRVPGQAGRSGGVARSARAVPTASPAGLRATAVQATVEVEEPVYAVPS